MQNRKRDTDVQNRLWDSVEKARVGCSERIALKQIYYQVWNRSPAQVGCMRQVLRAGALGRHRGMGWRGRGDRDGEHMEIHGCFMSMYVKTHYNSVVISLQLIKINEKKKSLLQGHSSKGIDVRHLSVTLYSPYWNLTTKTEFKQYAKMRIKTQWPTYIHLATGVTPVVFKGQACVDLMQE